MKRPRLRFSVFGMMVGIAIIALGLRYVYPARVQRQAVAAITAAGGTVQYDWELKLAGDDDFPIYVPNPAGRPAWPSWLVKAMGVDYFGTVKVVINGATSRPFDDQLIAQIAQLGQLEYLYLNDGGTITDQGLASLRKLPMLRQFRLDRNPNVSGAFLENLSGAARLQSLELSGIPLKSSDLITLKQFPELRNLYLIDCGLTDEALDPLKGFSNLYYLTLTKNPISDAGLKSLKGLVNLRSLAINITKITGQGLVSLEELKNLWTIKLDRTGVDDLTSLRNLSKLQVLTVGACPIDDDDLAVIETLGALQGIAIQRTRITDAGLVHLEKAPALMTVELNGTGATKEGVAALRLKRPNMKIME